MASVSMKMNDESSLLHGCSKIDVEVYVEHPNVTSRTGMRQLRTTVTRRRELASRGGMSPGRAGEYR